MRIFLTGGTGLLGSHIAERLRARGDQVVALVRSSSDSSHLESIGCDMVVGTLEDAPNTMAARMRGADAVIHAAAKVFQSGSRAEYLRVNLDGTERLLEAASMSAPRFIHISSVAVYAGLSMERPLTEDRWTEADPDRQSPYAASKHLSERAAWRAHEMGKVELTALRPSVVYGERDRSATPVMVRYASLPLVPLIDGGRTTLPVVYAGNAADGIVAALDRRASVGRAYNLALDLPLNARQLVSLLGAGLRRSPRTFTLPGRPLGAMAAGIRALTRSIPALPTLDGTRVIRSLSHDNPYDSRRARAELDWDPRISHEEGVRRAVEWWLQRDRSGH